MAANMGFIMVKQFVHAETGPQSRREEEKERRPFSVILDILSYFHGQ